MEDQRYDRQSERGKAAGSQNRFWMGVLTGALVMAFVGLIIVGMSAGIYLFGRRVISLSPALPLLRRSLQREWTLSR